MPFLGQWCGTEAGFDPLRHTVVTHARLLHVPRIFIAGNRTPAERTVGNRLAKGLFMARSYFGFDQITHGKR